MKDLIFKRFRPSTWTLLVLVMTISLDVPTAPAGVHYQRIKSFGFPDLGVALQAPLIQGSDGALYGTTYLGGANNAGVVFSVNRDGSGYSVLHSFLRNGVDGQNPQAGLVEGSDGALYGTTQFGGSNNAGTVFKIDIDGTGYRGVCNFGNGADDGTRPLAAVVEGKDGLLYGTTSYGGIYGFGAVFRTSKDGSNYNVLASFPPHSFSEEPSPNSERAWLLQGSDGALYGTRSLCGSISNAVGSVFRLNTDGSAYTVLHDFISGGTDGNQPAAGLIEGSDSSLYGTTASGGADGSGALFSPRKDGSNYDPLRSFSRVGPDGHNTYAGLVQGPQGAFYGTTFGGGTSGSGTVFKVSGDGTGYVVLRSFTSSQGSAPYGGLLVGSDAMLYGTTASGGTAGGGAVFKLSTDGTAYTILHNFTYMGGDGNFPVAAMIEGSDGALYGTTLGGGTNGAGTVFRLAKDASSYSVLYSFLGATDGDGQGPNGGVIEATNGVLYGTTWFGGINNEGTVFRIGRDGSGYSVLHLFKTTPGDGANPFAGLVQDTDGALYGTTENGGTNAGGGTVFRIDTAGTGYRVIHSFNRSGGAMVEGSLIEGLDGALYSTTSAGGTNNLGTAFRLTKDGTRYSVLYNFSPSAGDGRSPYSGLVQGSDGVLYGTTDGGGEFGFGTVFKMWPPETPDMVSVSAVGDIARVTIAGMAGYNYQVSRSMDLTNWLALPPIIMPASGIYTNVDSDPLHQALYYRAAWVP